MATETKKDKFKRIANLRVNNTLKQIELIGNLSNQSLYEYTSDDLKKILGTLNEKIKEVESRFKKEMNKKNRFSL